MTTLDDVVGRLEKLLADVHAMDEPTQARVFELLEGFDAVHRMALERLGEVLGEEDVRRLREADPTVGWLLDTYGVGIDEAAAARALDEIRPYIHSHGGEVEVLEVSGGVVRVRLSGACSGCTASAITLQEGIQKALVEGLPGFASLEVEEGEAEAHPPPGPTLVQLQTRTTARGDRS